MRILINSAGEKLTKDPWPSYSEDESTEKDPGPSVNAGADLELSDYALIQLQQVSQVKQQLAGQKIKLGLSIPGDLTAQQLTAELGDEQLLHHFSLIQVNIPVLKDGRCFSLAARLRNQFKYSGELRAAGNYLPDQIYFLQRCGFNSFSIATELDAKTLAQTLKPFSEVYQPSVDDAATVIEKRLAD